MTQPIPEALPRPASCLAGRWMITLGCLLWLVSGSYGCSSGSSSNYSSLSRTDQLTNGRTIYTQTCATSSCHGTRGEGILSGGSFSAWPLVGSIFQSRHPNAEIVFDVVRSGDEQNLRALTDQQIYDSIAYELSLNDITLAAPLTSANAYSTLGGKMPGRSAANGLFPPSGDVEPVVAWPHAVLPLGAAAGSLRLQVDEFAEAKSIAGIRPPTGGVFLMLVFVLTDTERAAIKVGPENMTLTTSAGESLPPEPIDSHSAIERFHDQTIEPEHGTAGLVVFGLASPDEFGQLVYSDADGSHLAVSLKP